MREIALKRTATDIAQEAKQRLLALEAVQPGEPVRGVGVQTLVLEPPFGLEEH